MAVASAPADDAAPRCIEVPEMKTQPRSCCPWLTRLVDRLRPAAVAVSRAQRIRTDAAADSAAEADAKAPGACGWFDSSHELVRGLQVQELNSPESLAAALPLATWLQLQLDGCGGVQPARWAA
jgi:hypothetical protein